MSRPLSRAASAAALLLTLPLAACGAEESTRGAEGAGGAGESSQAFEPVTIEHAFGTTEITEEPQRVVTWGWASGDAALALGVVPVAMPENSYGALESGLMPWQAEAIEAAGAETPQLLTEGTEVPVEEVLKAQPDLILANYSGLTEAEYEKLSKIADTVAYPDQPWATPWRDVITTVGQALGRSEEAEDLLADIDGEVAAAAEAHPEFEGKTIAAVAIDPAAFYVYRAADPRVQFLEDLGFELAPSVGELDTEETTFYYTISTEEVDKLTSDVLLSYVADEERAAEIRADETYEAMQQFRDGTVADVVGESYVSAVSPPTALSLTWGIDHVVEALVPAVEAAG